MLTTRLRATVIGLVTLAIVGAFGGVTVVSAGAQRHAHRVARVQQQEFHDAMRKLWEDHVTWTRMFIVEAAAGSEATDATAARLLRNQVDIGNAIKPFYGEPAGKQLTALLQEHILVAADILDKAKAGDQNAVNKAVKRWYANANEVAAFLSAANPKHWPRAEMRAMTREHLDLTLKEAVARLQGDFKTDIAVYDEIHDQILHMADMLSDGIVAQFPRSFR